MKFLKDSLSYWESPAYKTLAIAMAVPVLAIFLHSGALWHGPIWDDGHFVADQPFLRECSNLARVASPKTLLRVLPIENSARPIWLASVLVDRCVYQDAFTGYLLSNVLWMSLGAVLLIPLAQVFGVGLKWGCLAALLFVAHPVHTESTNLVAFRTDELALFFMELALCLYLQRGSSARRPIRAVLLAGSCAAYAFALLSKEMAVTLPVLIILADQLLTRKAKPKTRARDRAWAYAAFASITVLFLMFRAPRSGYDLGGGRDQLTQFSKSLGLADTPAIEAPGLSPVGARLYPDFITWRRAYERSSTMFWTMSGVFGSYLSTLVVPIHLQGDYAPKVRERIDPAAFLGLFGWTIVGVCAWRVRRRSALGAFGLAWMLVSLAPVSGVIKLLNLQADRYLYIPSAGYCLAVAAGAAALQRACAARRAMAWVPTAAACALLAALAMGTVARQWDYRSEETFLLATNAADPNVPRVHLNLARLYESDGRRSLAEASYRRALEAWPECSMARIFLARLLLIQDRRAQAKAVLDAVPKGAPREDEIRGILRRL